MVGAIADFIENNNRIAIALDVDQVLADPFGLIVKELNRKYGKSYSFEDLKDYPSPGRYFLGATNEEFVEIYDRLWIENWREIPKLASADLLARLSKAFKVDIVSGRGEKAAPPLRKWLELNYPEMRNNVVVIEKFKDKSVLPYNVFIDDAPRLADTIEAIEGKLLLLVDAPYNRHVKETSKVIRFPDADSACKALMDRAARA
ncbi:MAG TPA: hypothetical protein VL945_00600 [Candidatus Saccharimonadales bacterium]|nr:hypothetical protein [Candidatus Saccharimonadales bacterium]